jgi:NADH-quinone oxidoreductase subunit N
MILLYCIYWWSFQGLSAYVLASAFKNSTLSIEAGLKYFILGSIASGFLLFGMSMLYGYFGTLLFS